MPGKYLWKRVLSVSVKWRCKRCKVVSVMPDEGGLLLCGCPDQPHTDWELQVMSNDGPLDPSRWYDPKLMETPFN